MFALVLPIRLLLGATFLIAGGLKLAHWAEFHDTFSVLELFPHWLTEVVSRILGPFEIVLGLWALSGWRPALAGAVLSAVLLGFVAGLGIHRLRGNKRLVCGCFADSQGERSTSALILRNLLLLAAVGLLWFAPAPAASPGWTEWLLASATAAGAALSWMVFSRFAETVALVRRYDAAGGAR